MASFLNRWWSTFRERRHHREPIRVERRRGRVTLKEADKQLADALDRMDKACNLRRDDVLKRYAINDAQQEVQFETFAHICPYRSVQGEFTTCRHQSHPAARSGVAMCSDEVCPIFVLEKAVA